MVLIPLVVSLERGLHRALKFMSHSTSHLSSFVLFIFMTVTRKNNPFELLESAREFPLGIDISLAQSLFSMPPDSDLANLLPLDKSIPDV